MRDYAFVWLLSLLNARVAGESEKALLRHVRIIQWRLHQTPSFSKQSEVAHAFVFISQHQAETIVTWSSFIRTDWKLSHHIIMSTRNIVLRLYKDLLGESSKFNSYYYRNYFTRKIRLEFRRNKNADEESTKVLIGKAQSGLGMLRRQTSIVNSYCETKLVIE
jgi:hypothetical protein